MLELYNSIASTCSQKVRLTLAEKGLSFTDRQVSLKDNEQLSEWYLKLNPNGVVPTLVHDGRPVVDSSVITEYLDEIFPEPGVVPHDAFTRARMRVWRQYTDEVPTPAIRIPSFNAYIAPTWKTTNENWAVERLDKTPLRKSFIKRLGPQGFSAEDVAEAVEKLRKTCERMDAALDGGPWLVGTQFTLADIGLVPTLVRMNDIGLATVWRDLPRVQSWFERVQARPSFAATYLPGSRLRALAPLRTGAAVPTC